MNLIQRIPKISINQLGRLYATSSSSSSSSSSSDGGHGSAESSDKKVIPSNQLEQFHTAHMQKENGAIFDKKPFKMTLDASKSYSWCLCGKSKLQPICDGTHKNVYLKIKLRPIRFKVEKTGEYWLCNCKQTKNRPFCDGTHKQPHIQQAIKS